MPDKPTLHVCHIDDGGAKIHPCRRAAQALTAAGVDHDRSVFGKNIPMGLFSKGRRPALKSLSGQEKLPVLELPDGSTINGSGKIVAWARAHAA